MLESESGPRLNNDALQLASDTIAFVTRVSLSTCVTRNSVLIADWNIKPRFAFSRNRRRKVSTDEKNCGAY